MAADYVIDGKIGVDLTATYASTSAGSSSFWPAKPGDRVNTTGNGVYMFCRAASTIAQYDCVAFAGLTTSATSADASNIFCPQAVPITTAHVASAGPAGFGAVGIAQTAIASANYGWVAMNGTNLRVNTLVSCQPNVQLYTTTTGGSLDDTVVSAGLIEGLTIMTSATSASAPRCVANWPHIALYALQA